MKLLFYQDNELMDTYNHVKKLNGQYEYINETTHMVFKIVNKDLLFTYENNEGILKLQIGLKNLSTYTLKEYNYCVDIPVIKGTFHEYEDKIVIQYVLETNSNVNKIEIVKED